MFSSCIHCFLGICSVVVTLRHRSLQEVVTFRHSVGKTFCSESILLLFKKSKSCITIYLECPLTFVYLMSLIAMIGYTTSSSNVITLLVSYHLQFRYLIVSLGIDCFVETRNYNMLSLDFIAH